MIKRKVSRDIMELQPNKPYYTPYKFKKVEPKYFLRNDPDFRQEKNLLSGKGQAIISYGAIEEDFCVPHFNTPDTENRLTDGVYAERATYSDPAFMRFSRGVARSIVFDLGAIAAVREFRIRMLRENETGVRLPRNVSFSVS